MKKMNELELTNQVQPSVIVKTIDALRYLNGRTAKANETLWNYLIQVLNTHKQ
jgi:hypothetical protein